MSRARASGKFVGPLANLPEKEETAVRAFRLLHVVAHEMRWLTDDMLRDDGVTTQQAALITVVRSLGSPSLSGAADALSTSHQNIKQIALGLTKKGLLKIVRDKEDARVLRLVTTAKNERYWAARDRADFGNVARWFSHLSAKEQSMLVSLLAALHRGLGSEIAAAKARGGQTRRRRS